MEFALLMHIPGLTYSDLQRMSAEKVSRFAVYLDEVLKIREEAARKTKHD